MKNKLYRVSGTLNGGFVGQITYTICLPKTFERLDIGFRFDRQHYPDMESVPKKELEDYCLKEYGLKLEEDTDQEAVFLKEMKTEIHLMATLNDEFIGCIHKQLLERHMIFEPNEASEGCIPPASLSGVLKVTVLAFNILMDDTDYELWVSAE